MVDKTSREILNSLFVEALRRQNREDTTRDPRVEVLVTLVFDLLMEVEALRKAMLASGAGAGGSESAYGRAYRDTVYLTHDATGPSGGLEKLLELFYPEQAELDSSREPRTWRESLLLRRLGFSAEEVLAYKREAEVAETFT